MRNALYLLTVIFAFFLVNCSESNAENEPELPELNCENTETLILNDNITISTEESAQAFIESGYTEINGDLNVFFAADLDFLKCVTKVKNLLIDNCEIIDFEGLESLQEVSKLVISNCDNITNLQGLESLTSLEHLEIQRNENLINLQGLSNVNSLGYLIVEENDNLLNLNGLNNLTSINTSDNINFTRIDISDNINLESIAALSNINSGIIDRFSLYQNLELTELSVINGVETVGPISVTLCPKIINANLFPDATFIQSINFGTNNVISSITFPKVEHIGYLGVNDNPLLINLQLPLLEEISGGGNGDFSVIIKNNDSLTNLDGLISLSWNELIVSINTTTSEFENALTNICGLRNLIIGNLANSNFDNPIRFRTSCYGVLAGQVVLENFDANCNCD